MSIYKGTQYVIKCINEKFCKSWINDKFDVSVGNENDNFNNKFTRTHDIIIFVLFSSNNVLN